MNSHSACLRERSTRSQLTSWLKFFNQSNFLHGTKCFWKEVMTEQVIRSWPMPSWQKIGTRSLKFMLKIQGKIRRNNWREEKKISLETKCGGACCGFQIWIWWFHNLEIHVLLNGSHTMTGRWRCLMVQKSPQLEKLILWRAVWLSKQKWEAENQRMYVKDNNMQGFGIARLIWRIKDLHPLGLGHWLDTFTWFLRVKPSPIFFFISLIISVNSCPQVLLGSWIKSKTD